MAYITNPVYCGVGSVDTVDKDSALANMAAFRARYQLAFNLLAQLSPAQRAYIQSSVNNTVAQLPQAQQRQIQTTATVAVHSIDPRGVPGLGQGADVALTGLQTTAQIAGIIASLATTSLGIASFISSKKASKAQQDAQAQQNALITQQMQLDIDTKKKALAAQQQQADNQTKMNTLSASGLTLDAQGSVVKKTSGLATAGALAAAVTGAFLITK